MSNGTFYFASLFELHISPIRLFGHERTCAWLRLRLWVRSSSKLCVCVCVVCSWIVGKTAQLDGNELLCHELIENVALLLTLEKYCTHKNILFVYLWIVKMPLDSLLTLLTLLLLSRILFLCCSAFLCAFPSLICTHACTGTLIPAHKLINGKTLFENFLLRLGEQLYYKSTRNAWQFLSLSLDVSPRHATLAMEKVTPTPTQTHIQWTLGSICVHSRIDSLALPYLYVIGCLLPYMFIGPHDIARPDATVV